MFNLYSLFPEQNSFMSPQETNVFTEGLKQTEISTKYITE